MAMTNLDTEIGIVMGIAKRGNVSYDEIGFVNELANRWGNLRKFQHRVFVHRVLGFRVIVACPYGNATIKQLSYALYAIEFGKTKTFSLNPNYVEVKSYLTDRFNEMVMLLAEKSDAA